jgi:hypothetical protein
LLEQQFTGTLADIIVALSAINTPEFSLITQFVWERAIAAKRPIVKWGRLVSSGIPVPFGSTNLKAPKRVGQNG